MDRRIRAFPAVVGGLALVLASCAADELLGPNAPQGIAGLALLGPQCPVQSDQDPCPDQPHQVWITVRTTSGDALTRIRSDTAGVFRVGLKPGNYRLDPDQGNPFPTTSPEDVVVDEGVFTQVTLFFDTGIR